MTIRTNGQIIAGAGGASTWGDITGDLTDQTDLNEALESKLDTTQITNCITEIPQDIKIELNNGTLTLKAGSKVYVPNGAGVFDEVTVDSDKTTTWLGTGQGLVYFDGTNNTIVPYFSSSAYSGNTAPTSITTTYGFWYDITNNLIKFTDNSGSSWSSRNTSLPLALISGDGNQITSIDQVFNGFGYIGSTVFALPNVKGLIPNGRNDDGTLKNTEININSVVTFNFPYANQPATPLLLGLDFMTANVVYEYNEKINYVYESSSGDLAKDRFIVGKIATNSSSQISLLEIKTAFHAVDYNDFSDLSDKVDTNISNITTLQNTKQDVATAVNYDNISNCITEIPQDINLELSNGTLTLKAGSKVYIPNGSGVFDIYTLDSDRTLTFSENGAYNICVTPTKALDITETRYNYSGNTQPTGIGTYSMWYDTDNNLIKKTENGGSTWGSGYSLPIAQVTCSGGTITSIDQVFNGFGYIGSTIFALPGVKGLIPNGRNADGTLKSIEFETSNVLTFTRSDSATEKTNIAIRENALSYHKFVYNEVLNTTTAPGFMNAGDIIYTSGRITSLTPKTAFRAVDYNDFKQADDNNIKLTSLVEVPVLVSRTENTVGGYTEIWSDGYCIQTGKLERTATGILNITLPEEYVNARYSIQATNVANETYTSASTFYTPYALNIATTGFSLSSNAAIANIKYFAWETKGYIS